MHSRHVIQFSCWVGEAPPERVYEQVVTRGASTKGWFLIPVVSDVVWRYLYILLLVSSEEPVLWVCSWPSAQYCS